MYVPIWPGSSSYVSGSSTSFGYYDDDPVFRQDADYVAAWCARRLGYPIVDVELQAVNFWAAFEEAVNEYGNQVNTSVSRDNILYLLGADTGSQNISQEYIEPRSDGFLKLADDYGTVAGVGGHVTYYTGSIEMVAGIQTYDLDTNNTLSLETGSINTDGITIRQIHHYAPPALVRYLDPFVAGGSVGALDGFGWSGYLPSVNYVLYPLNYDLLRIQGIEFNEQIRKSAYSFSLINKRLKIFPIPESNYTLHFEYTLNSEAGNPVRSGNNKISDYSNVPYQNMKYFRINQMGKQWIRKYTLALCKETLAWVRGKFENIPIPDSEVRMNAQDLLENAEAEKEMLIEELKEILDQFSRKNLLERKKEETDAIESGLEKYPLGFYIG